MRESFTSVFTADRSSQSKQDPYIGIVPPDPTPSPFCVPGLWNTGRKSRCCQGKTQERLSPLPQRCHSISSQTPENTVIFTRLVAWAPKATVVCCLQAVRQRSTAASSSSIFIRRSLVDVPGRFSAGCATLKAPVVTKETLFSSSQQAALLWAFKSRTDLSWVPLILFNVPFP